MNCVFPGAGLFFAPLSLEHALMYVIGCWPGVLVFPFPAPKSELEECLQMIYG